MGALKSVFQDPNWKNNVLFAALFMFIPFVGPLATTGWMCEAHQRLTRRHPQPVPKIDFADFGDYLRRGVPAFLAGLVITLPLMFLIYGSIVGAALSGGFITSTTGEPLYGLLVACAVGLVGMLFSMVAMVFLNAVQTRAELTESFGKTLALGELFSYTKKTFGKTLIKMIGFSFVAFFLFLLGMLLCYIGLYPAIAVIQIAGFHLRAQIYEDYLSRGGPPIEVAEPVALQSEIRLQQMGKGY